MSKVFFGALSAEFPQDSVTNPFELAGQIEALFRRGIEELKAINPELKISLNANFMTKKTRKETPAPVALPATGTMTGTVDAPDPNQTDIEDAIAATRAPEPAPATTEQVMSFRPPGAAAAA